MNQWQGDLASLDPTTGVGFGGLCRHTPGKPQEESEVDLHLKGKNAVILGGTRGIGRAIADTLAGEGANVAVCARNEKQVTETIEALQAKGVKATGASVDITDEGALKSWIRKAGVELGGIDILVSNAGAMAQGNTPEAWTQNFQLDVLGAVNAFNAAEPFLDKAAKSHGDAAFVIIASVSAAQADRADSYGPIKASLIHFAKGLARENAGKRLRVNVVSPGMVYFEGGIWHMIEKNQPEFFKQANARNPTGRCATPQEIANAAVFLASPASSYTTGVNLIVDGAVSNRVNF
jgi:3-oxoacyl-[acyl-carrier protein] reductase